MSPRNSAPVFAALGDELRLRMVERLSALGPASLAKLAQGAEVSRQAIVKHLRVLEQAGVVTSRRQGRANVYRLQAHRLLVAQRFLDKMSARWDDALGRLKAFVETDEER